MTEQMAKDRQNYCYHFYFDFRLTVECWLAGCGLVARIPELAPLATSATWPWHDQAKGQALGSEPGKSVGALAGG